MPFDCLLCVETILELHGLCDSDWRLSSVLLTLCHIQGLLKFKKGPLGFPANANKPNSNNDMRFGSSFC